MRPASLLVGVPLIVDCTTLRHDQDEHISRTLVASKHFHCMPTSPTSKSAQTGAHESPHPQMDRILSTQYYRVLLRAVHHTHMPCAVLYPVLVRRRVVNYPPHSFPYQQQYIPLSDTSNHP